MSVHRTAPTARTTCRMLARLAATLAKAARRGWRAHRDLLVSNAAYAATVAAIAAALATQSELPDLLAALLAGALAIHRTLRGDDTDY